VAAAAVDGAVRPVYGRTVLRTLTFLALALLALSAAGCGAGSTKATTTVASKVKRVHLPANVVRIHWRASSLVPAKHPGRVCIVTLKLGHVCAAYKVGEVPADALGRKLGARGLVVLPVP
jgi:hypothetical protein